MKDQRELILLGAEYHKMRVQYGMLQSQIHREIMDEDFDVIHAEFEKMFGKQKARNLIKKLQKV